MEEKLYTLALSRLRGISQAMAMQLYQQVGNAGDIFLHHKELENLSDEGRRRLNEAMSSAPEVLKRAENELEFAERNNISTFCFNDTDYPTRLRECDDAPLVLFYRGSVSLNAARILSVVGTRRITEQGKDLCRNLCRELQEAHPDLLIVSGLAYGVDIHAHRGALEFGLPTVGVLAHGLDRIYPAGHRTEAVRMVKQGGLLTEYMSGTNPDKGCFVRRNRIVAGMADATIVVESAAKGGALITATLAGDYNRTVLAFPGRPTDRYSEGCNALIRDNKAALITSAADVLSLMGWTPTRKKKKPVEQDFFLTLSEEEQRIRSALINTDGLQINRLAVLTGISVGKLSALLFELELKGKVKPMSGGNFRWTD